VEKNKLLLYEECVYIYSSTKEEKKKEKTENESCRNYFSFVLIIKKEVPEEILEITNKNFNIYFPKELIDD